MIGYYGPEPILSLKGQPQIMVPVSIYVPDTSTLATTIYTSRAGTTQAQNPVLTDSQGNISFYAEVGEYDLALKSGYRVRIIVEEIPGGTLVNSVNGKTGIVVIDATDVGADPDGIALALVTSESEIREAADLDFQSQLDTEVSARTSGDTLLATDITNIDIALDSKADLVNGIVPTSELPPLNIGHVFVVDSEVEMLALSAVEGDVAIRPDISSNFILGGTDPTILDNWYEFAAPTGNVLSVNGQIGNVVLGSADVGADPLGRAQSLVNIEATTRANADILRIPLTQKNTVNGVPGLNAQGKINPSQLPHLAISETFVDNSEAAMLGHSIFVQTGDISVRTDVSKTFIFVGGNSSHLSQWVELLTPTGGLSGVSSVNGRSGTVVGLAEDSDLDAEANARIAGDDNEATDRANADTTLQSNIDAAEAEIASINLALPNKADLSGGKVVTSQIPALAISETFVANSQAAMLALTAQTGDIAIRTDVHLNFILSGTGDPTVLSNWVQLEVVPDTVTSVNGHIGTVVLGASDVGADASGAAAGVQTNLNTEITNRTNADSSEATTRANADTTLQTNIDNEASARTSGDTAAIAYAIQRANHTGTQHAATIDDLVEAVQDIVAAFSINGTHISIAYDDTANTLTFSVTGLASTDLSDFTEAVQDVIGALALGGSGLTFTYNDSTNTAGIDVNVDNSSIEINADTLRIKAGGVTNAMLAGSIANTKLTTNPLDRANHTGTQAMATISDAGSLATKNAVGSSDITDGSVANADLANMANKTYKGRHTAGTGPPEDVSTTNMKSDLAIVAADVSDFDTQVRTSRLDQMAAPTADVSINSKKITSLADATAATDALNRQTGDARYDASGAASGKIDKTLGGRETVSTIATAGSSQTLDLTNGNVFDVTLDQATCTIGFTGFTNAVGCSCTLILRQGNASARLVTWNSAIKWSSATAPTLSVGVNKVDVLTFVSVDGGTTILGFMAGADMR